MKKTITLHEYTPYPLKGNFSANEVEHLSRLNKVLVPNRTVFDISATHIKPRSIVGAISVGNKHIEILPKLLSQGHPCSGNRRAKQTIVKNLIHMLSYTNNIDAIDADSASLQAYNGSFLEAYIGIFANRLLRLLNRYAPGRYVLKEESLGFVRGKIYFKEHLKNEFARKGKVHCIFDEFSSDNLISQTFKFVCRKLLKQTASLDTHKKLKKCLDYLCPVEDRQVSAMDASTIQISRPNSEFLHVFNLAKLFLNHMRTNSSQGRDEVSSILFDMNTLFEEYIFLLLKRNEDVLGIRVKDQNKKRLVDRVRLLGGAWEKKAQFNTYTDIAISFDSGQTLIIDTKYKLLDRNKPHWNIKNADVYQILAYRLLHSGNGGFPEISLLYPENEEPLAREFSLNNMEHKFSAFTINLHKDLRSSEADLIGQLASIFKEIVGTSKAA